MDPETLPKTRASVSVNVDDENYIKKDEFMEVFEAIKSAIAIVRQDVNGNVDVNVAYLDERIDALNTKLATWQLEGATKEEVEVVRGQVFALELDLRALIDQKFAELEIPDTSPLLSRAEYQEDRAKIIAESTQEVPFKTAVDLRDALERLEGDERLDISAIKGWEDFKKDIDKKVKNNEKFYFGTGGGDTPGISDITDLIEAGTNITITGTGTEADPYVINAGGGMAIGGSITSATEGSLLFAGPSGVLAQDNTNFFVHDVADNHRIRIGPAAGSRVQIGQSGSADYGGVWFGNITPNTTNYAFLGNTTSTNFNVPAGGSMYFSVGNVNKWIMDPSGNMGVGTVSPLGKLHVVNDAGAAFAPSYMDVYGTGTVPGFYFRRARGSLGTPSAVVAGDYLGEFPAQGYLNADFRTAADLTFQVDSAAGSIVSSNIGFWTTNAAGSFAERMRITGEGKVGIGTTAPTGKFDVVGMASDGTYSHTMKLGDDTAMAQGVGGVILFSGKADGGGAQYYGSFIRASKTNGTSGNFAFDLSLGSRENGIAPTIKWRVKDVGHFLAEVDNTYDIGASGATRPRTGYFGTSVVTPAVTVSGLTSGSVPFFTTGGAMTEDNTNFSFNDAANNHRLKIGATTQQVQIGQINNVNYSGIWFGNVTPTISNYAFLGGALETNLNVPTGGGVTLNVNNVTKMAVHADTITAYTDLIFNTDNTDDIGASGATRPRTGYFGTSIETRTVNLTGTVSNLSAMPALNFKFSGDADPVISYVAYEHDNVAMVFDAWQNGTNWTSSDVGSNFAWYKSGDLFYIGTKSGIAKGSTFATFDTRWSITTGGNVVQAGSLNLPTIELGHATDTTLSRVSAGVVAIEGVNILTTATGLALSGGTMTGAITLGENTSIALDPAGSADGKYTGITIAGTAGAALAFGDVIVLDVTDSRWELADANSASAADGDARGMIGICVLAAAGDGSATTILLQGTVRADTAFPALTIGAPVYLSETAGDVTVTKPTTTDAVIRTLGFALTADEMYWNPSSDYITAV